jgi:hypothetical protein
LLLELPDETAKLTSLLSMHLGGCDALTRPFVADVERLLCRLDKIKPRGLMGIKALPFQIYEKVSEVLPFQINGVRV